MKEKTKNFIDKYKELLKNYNEKSIIENPSYEDNEFLFFNEITLKKINERITQYLLNTLDTREKTKDYCKKNNISLGNIPYRIIIYEAKGFLSEEQYKKCLKKDNGEEYSEEEVVKNFESKLFEVDKTKYEEYINKANDSLKRYLTSKIIIKTEEDIDKVIDDFSNNNIDVDEVFEDENLLLPADKLAPLIEKHPLEKQIEDLKKEYPNYKDVLEKANNYIVTGDAESVNRMLNASESLGKFNDKKFVNEANEKLIKDGKNYFTFNKDNKSALSLKKEVFLNNDGTNVYNAYNSLETYSEDLPDDYVKKIVDIVRDCNELDGGNFESYSKAQDELSNAINSKNIEKIVEATKNIEEVEKKYDSIFKRIDELGDKTLYVGNLTSARAGSLPAKYRNNFRPVSIYRAFLNFGLLKKHTGMDYEELIKNPVKTSLKATKFIANNSPIANKIKNNPNNALEILYGDQKQVETKYDMNNLIHSGQTRLLPDCYANLACLLPKENRDKLLAYNFGYFAVSQNFFVEHTDVVNLKNKEEVASNLLIMEDKDRSLSNFYKSLNKTNLIDLKSKKFYEDFNPVKYIKDNKIDVNDIALRIAKSYKTYEFNNARSSKNIYKKASDVLLNNFSKDLNSDSKKFLKQFSAKKPEKISMNKYDYFIKKQELIKDAKTGMIEAHIDDTIKTIKDLESEYAHRNTFWKLFGSETKMLSSTIEEMKNTMKQRLGNERFEQFYSGGLTQLGSNKKVVKENKIEVNENKKENKIIDNNLIDTRVQMPIEDKELETNNIESNNKDISEDFVVVNKKEVVTQMLNEDENNIVNTEFYRD